MRHLHGEAERVPARLAKAQLEQGGRAARHLDPARQPLVTGQQFLAGGVRDHAERPGVRHAGRDAQEADRGAGVEPGRDGQHGLGEQVPFVIWLRPGQQQEGPLALVVQQVQSKLRRVVAFPAAVVVGHQRAPRPVVDQPVSVEPRHRLVREGAQQVLGEQAARGSCIDEALQVVQHRCACDIGRGRTELVEFLRIPLHPYSFPRSADCCGPGTGMAPGPLTSRVKARRLGRSVRQVG